MPKPPSKRKPGARPDPRDARKAGTSTSGQIPKAPTASEPLQFDYEAMYRAQQRENEELQNLLRQRDRERLHSLKAIYLHSIKHNGGLATISSDCLAFLIRLAEPTVDPTVMRFKMDVRVWPPEAAERAKQELAELSNQATEANP